MNKKVNISFRRENIILIFTGIAVFFVLLYGFQRNREVVKKYTGEFNEQQLLLARSAAKSIEAFMDNIEDNLIALSGFPAVQRMGSDVLEEMEAMNSAFPLLTSLRRLDKNGILCFIYPDERWRRKLVGRDYGKSSWFIQTKETKKIIISGLIRNEMGKMRIRMAYPVFIGDGKGSRRFNGVIVASIDPEILNKMYISPVVSGKTGYAWLLNEEGIFLAHYDEEFVGENAFLVRTERNPDISYEETNNIQRKMMAGEEWTGHYVAGWHRKQRGRIEKLIAYTPVHMNNRIWSVAVCAPFDEVRGLLHVPRRHGLFAVGLIILVLIAGGAFLFMVLHRYSLSLEGEVNRRTRQLQESEERYRTSLEEAPIGICNMDLSSKVTYVNKRFEEVSGYSREEILGKNGFELGMFNEETLKLFAKRLKDRLMGKPPRNLEVRFKCKDGRQIWVEIGAKIIKRFGIPVGFQFASRDITERRLAEETLKYRIRFEKLISTLSTHFTNLPSEEIDKGMNYVLQKIGEFADVDRSYVFLLCDNGTKMDNTHEWCAEGIEPQIDNLKGLSLDIFPWHPEKLNRFENIHISSIPDLPSEASALKEALQAQGIKSILIVPIIYGGSLVGFIGFDSVQAEESWAEENIDLLRIVGEIFANALARKKAEEKIRESERKLQNIIDNMWDVIFHIDMEGNFTFASKIAEKVMGYSVDELLNMNIRELIVSEQSGMVFQAFEKRIANKFSELPFTVEIVHKDGHRVTLEITTTEIQDSGGELIGIQGIARDITERRRMEQELQKVEKLESLGILAGGLAHDFNNILTAILGNISLAKMRLNPEDKIFQGLAESEKASLRAKDLTQRLLTFAKGGAPIKETSSIKELIKDTVTFVLSGSNDRCNFSIQDDLYPVEVDRTQFCQVINNMVLNALQAMPEGGIIKIGAKNETIGSEEPLPIRPGEYVKISIQDQGIGIKEGHLNKIFDPFFTTKNKGSGLGLSTSYSIIKKHDGCITVDSKVGIGTTFSIYLPASEKEMPKKEEISGEPLKGKGKILLMDDEKMVRTVAGRMLKHIGYNVKYARDGVEAIELYTKAREKNEPFDAVILDLTIKGGMGGKKAIRELLKIDSEVRAIVSSGYADDPVLADFKGHGFSGFIAKPYSIQRLSEVLHKIVG